MSLIGPRPGTSPLASSIDLHVGRPLAAPRRLPRSQPRLRPALRRRPPPRPPTLQRQPMPRAEIRAAPASPAERIRPDSAGLGRTRPDDNRALEPNLARHAVLPRCSTWSRPRLGSRGPRRR
jgi:hypothetical protein